jgi:hypothetical protein
MVLSDTLQDLWELQLLDIEIMNLQEKLRNLDRGKELKDRIDFLSNLYNKKNDEMRKKEVSLRELEIELSSLEDRKRKNEERLYRDVTTQKEVDGLTQEIQHISETKSSIEDKILELMESLEELRNEIPTIKKEIEELEGSLKIIEDNARISEREILEKIQVLETKREEKSKGIDSKLLARYEAIRKNRRGRGMSKVIDGKCSECGVELSLSIVEETKHQEKILTCEHCGRILCI